MTELILPGYVEKANTEGKGKVVGLTPWRDINSGRGVVKGAVTKKAKWRDYYDMYRTHAIVRAAIDKIAKTSTNVGYDFVPRDSRAKIKKRELSILKEFFGKQNDFIYELRRVYKDMLIYGDAFLYVVPDRRRRPTKLKRLHPKTIHIKMSKNGQIEGYYQKDPDDIGDEVVRFEPQEILHFRIDDPDSDVYGLSPLESLQLAVGADLYAQRYNASFFMNSGITGTIIGVRNANPDEVERNRKWLQDNYTGPEAAHKPIIIEGESITISKSVANHNEMGFLEGRRFIIQEILAVLDVPPAKVGIMETANRSNSKEQDKTFRTESVSPLQYIVESVINDQFVRKILGVQETIFVHSEGDTRDAIEQMDYYTKGEAWGIFNANEIRAKFGMAPVEGGDINGIMSPTGFVPLDRLVAYFEPMQLPKNAVDTEEDPLAGEPVPGPTSGSEIATATSRDVSKSFEATAHPILAAQAALVKLAVSVQSDANLRQAYTYLVDAKPMGDSRLDNALDSVRKALKTKDKLLKQGYVERAQEAMGQFIVPMGDDGYVEPARKIAKQLDQEDAADDDGEDDDE
jgi:HK97 family phage portal protein